MSYCISLCMREFRYIVRLQREFGRHHVSFLYGKAHSPPYCYAYNMIDRLRESKRKNLRLRYKSIYVYFFKGQNMHSSVLTVLSVKIERNTRGKHQHITDGGQNILPYVTKYTLLRILFNFFFEFARLIKKLGRTLVASRN